MTPRRIRALGFAAAAILPVVGGLAAAAAALIAYRVIHPVRGKPTQITSAIDDRLVLTANLLTRFDGPIGLLHDAEQHLAVLAPDVAAAATRGQVERTVAQGATNRAIKVGSARATGNTFASPEAVDPRVVEVLLGTGLGAAPAWLFPGESSSSVWLVHVHGSLAGREGALRSVAATRVTGLPSIVPSFRGDPGAPPAPRGAFLLGQTEWEDIEPALAYATEHGARRIILVGWSAGAAVSFRLVKASSYRRAIAGVIAIAPVLDWTKAVRQSARTARLPSVAVDLAFRALAQARLSALLGAPEPLRPAELTVGHATVPTLLIHSRGDQTVPYDDSLAFRTANPTRVDLHTTRPAPHALEWNADPAQFEQVVVDWLDQLAATGD